MNPRQRRGVLFIALAVVGAVAVFFSIVGYVNDVESRVGDRVSALVVTKSVDAYSEIPETAVERVEIPERWLADTAIRDVSELGGVVAATQLEPGTQLQRSSVVPQPSLESGQRELAILIDAETGVAGKVQPGDYVDVWATFSEDDLGPRTKLIAQRLLVIEVGIQGTAQRTSSNGLSEEVAVVPVTFALDVTSIKALTYAESFADEVRLALRPPADESVLPADELSYEESFTISGNGKAR